MLYDCIFSFDSSSKHSTIEIPTRLTSIGLTASKTALLSVPIRGHDFKHIYCFRVCYEKEWNINKFVSSSFVSGFILFHRFMINQFICVCFACLVLYIWLLRLWLRRMINTESTSVLIIRKPWEKRYDPLWHCLFCWSSKSYEMI